jgi:hypothetical protein
MGISGSKPQKDDPMSKYLPHLVYLTLPGTGNKRVRVPVKAKPLKRTLAFFRGRADVEQGIQGECGTCANAIAAVRNELCQLAQFTDSRAYLVDKFDKNGVPRECFVGEHSQGEFQRQFDRNKKALLKSDQCEGVVTISPFNLKRHRNNNPNRPTGPKNGPTATQKKRERGAAARALRAGIVAA